MLCNKDVSLTCASVTLYPYRRAHVSRYHDWMRDPEIQSLTASEPLTLEQEYAMQTSWQSDADSEFFSSRAVGHACSSPSPPPSPAKRHMYADHAP